MKELEAVNDAHQNLLTAVGRRDVAMLRAIGQYREAVTALVLAQVLERFEREIKKL